MSRRLIVRRALLASSAATSVAGAVTGANRLGELPVSSLAATPAAVGSGKVWLILTSGLLADRPAVPSLIGFWLVAVAVLLVCSVRLVAGVAVGGHVLSALGVYGVVALVREVDGHAFASTVHVADYGLSAIIAAWLGAIARIFWARYPAPRARIAIALWSAGCAGIGLAFRPSVTFLDSEHLVAFGIGLALADPRLRERLTRPTRRLVAVTANLLLATRSS